LFMFKGISAMFDRRRFATFTRCRFKDCPLSGFGFLRMRQVRNLYPHKKDKQHNDTRHEPECFAMSQSREHLRTLADCFVKNKLLLGSFSIPIYSTIKTITHGWFNG